MENAWLVWWKDRSDNERYGVLGGVALVLVAAAALLYWALKPSYEVLFSGLAPKDVSGIANQLGVEGLDYEVDAKGGRILVAKDDVYAARIKVMERGLALSGPVGFELFDDADFGMTDFTQQINYQRALEGELARTIMALDEIEHARLHLVLPEAGLFRKPTEQPKASLTVVVKRDATLAPARVQGIQKLIAASVPGLEPRHVTVHDQMGMALTRSADAATTAEAATERLEAKQINEAYLTRKAQEVLDRAFGVGAAAVIVDVALDHNKRQSTREETLPVEGGVTGAVVRQRTSSSGPRNALAGPAISSPIGMASAWPPMNTEVEYAVGRNVEQLEVAPGAIHRLTVGVLVPRGLDAAAQTRMSELVASAVGLDLVRGDVLSLQELPVANAITAGDASAVPDAGSRAEGTLPLAGLLQIAAVSALIVGLLLWGVARLAFARGRAQAARPLTLQDRERLLGDLQQWLGSGDDRRPETSP